MRPIRRVSTIHPIEHLAGRRGAHGVLQASPDDQRAASACILIESRLTVLITVILAGWLAWSSAAKAEDARVEIDQAAALAGGVTMADAPGFPVTIDVPGAYVLTSDLVAPAHVRSPIVVGPQAGEASIDLNGFAIRREGE